MDLKAIEKPDPDLERELQRWLRSAVSPMSQYVSDRMQEDTLRRTISERLKFQEEILQMTAVALEEHLEAMKGLQERVSILEQAQLAEVS